MKKQKDPQAAGREALAAAIKASGLSARAYAEQVLTRDERTVRRWVSGKSPIPREVLRFLAAGARVPIPAADRSVLLDIRELIYRDDGLGGVAGPMLEVLDRLLAVRSTILAPEDA